MEIIGKTAQGGRAPSSSFGEYSNRGSSNSLGFSWWRWFGSTEDRRLVVNIVLGVRIKNCGLEVPVNHIDLGLRTEETFVKLRRCDIGRGE